MSRLEHVPAKAGVVPWIQAVHGRIENVAFGEHQRRWPRREESTAVVVEREKGTRDGAATSDDTILRKRTLREELPTRKGAACASDA